jgi:hypothetical protein
MYTFHDIPLSSGRIVHLDSLHMGRTYADLLQGTPDIKYNETVIARTRRALNGVWGERATHVIPPVSRTIVEAGRKYIRLPELTYYAWLTSGPLRPEWWSASELVVVWFGPRDRDTSIPALVEHAVRDLPWKRLAKHFNY